jgi:putative tryptophan/tyrosine transport system substrate-binding protein
MLRREFMTVLSGAAVLWPITARAAQSGKLATIGYMGPNTPSLDQYRLSAFVKRMSELGWVEGRTVAIDYRWAEGRTENLANIAAEFVQQKTDVIVTGGTPATIAAKEATSTIPIVFAAVGDPVGTGIVASLARPGGNVTGLSLQQTESAAKRLELLREVIPGLRYLALMANGSNASAALEMRETQEIAHTIGLEVVSSEIRRSEDIVPAFEGLKNRVEALYVCNDPLAATNRFLINTSALDARLPTMFGGREYIEAGGLISYSASFPDLFRHAADYVDKILRGTKPADLPVQQPTQFELVVNLKTAKALGLTVPPVLLARADEVIE